MTRGQSAIKPVRYAPPPGVGELELTSLAQMRERAGIAEFVAPQRLDFDLLIRVDSGHAVHAVDFASYPLGPGDVLWVRAGQIQQWGAIGDIDGPVFLFTPSAVDPGATELIRSVGVATPQHWPATCLAGSTAADALDVALAVAASYPESPAHRAAQARTLTTALLLLVLAAPAGAERSRPPTHEAFVWFRDEIEASFRTCHKVTEYAARLGYSTRTLNRLARENTGLTAKELIDERVVLEARRALAHGQETVARIAEELGFDDPSNFSAYFHQRTGLTPGEFRERTRTASS